MISVITPVLDGARYLPACVACVAAQVGTEDEHLIVDGGSSDGTVRLLAELAASHSHLRWSSEPGLGQSAALNRGIAMARGEIVGILNVDDSYEADVLSRVAARFAQLPRPAFVAGNCNVWGPDGGLLYVNRPARLELRCLLRGFERYPYPVNPSAYFYHRSLHDLVGPYSPAEEYALDVDFIFRAVQRAHLVYVNETWGNFHKVEGSKTLIDQRRGTSAARAKRLYRRYRRNLPLHQRVPAALAYECANTRLGRALTFASRHPLAAAGVLLRKTASPSFPD